MQKDPDSEVVDDEGDGVDVRGCPFPVIKCPFCGLTKSAGEFYTRLAGAELYCPDCGTRAR